MSRTRSLFAFLALLLVFYVGWRVYTRLPWIRIAASIHAERGAINCGDVEYSDGQKVAEGAISCAIDAHAKGRAFRVIFSVPGTDEHQWFALVGDSSSNVSEIFYATGMVEPHDTLLRRRCNSPVQLQVEDHRYGIPTLRCTPWPPDRLERDLLWW